MRRLLIPLLSFFLLGAGYQRTYNAETGLGDSVGVAASRDVAISCDDNAIIKYDLATGLWACDTDGAGDSDAIAVNTTAVVDALGADLTTGTAVSVTLNAAVSPDTATFDVVDDSIGATELADADFGDFTCADASGCDVETDSHAHTGGSLSAVDISADTNLTAGDNLTLTDDDLDLDAAISVATSVTSPLFLGGTAATSDLSLQTTSGIGAAGADMHFLVGNNGATEAMTILNSGNVGIGTTNPGHLLDLNGGTGNTYIRLAGGVANEQGFVIRDTQDRWALIKLANTSTLAFQDSSNYRMVLQDGGNVGIGTDQTPDYLLHVQGTLGVTSTLTLAGSAANIALGSNYLSGDGGDEGVFVDGSGNVGIGTTSPGVPLDIKLAAGTDVLRIGDGTNYFGFARNVTTGALSIQGSQAGDNNIALAPTSGNVGIGTAGPDTILHIKGANPRFLIDSSAADQEVDFALGSNGTTKMLFAYREDLTPDAFEVFLGGVGLSNLIWRIDTNGGMALGQYAQDRNAPPSLGLIVSGNVGIGTASPGAPLEVLNRIRIQSAAATRSYLEFSVNGAYVDSVVAVAGATNDIFTGTVLGDMGVRAETGQKLHLGVGGSIPMTLSAGNVGIGTTGPTNLLSLGGNSARTFWMERHTTANTAGNSLTVKAGGATSAATDKSGGSLILESGTATGTGTSAVVLQAHPAGATGTADTTAAEYFRASGSAGNVFNEDGGDIDFRIEGDTKSALFSADASNDIICIINCAGITTQASFVVSPTRTDSSATLRSVFVRVNDNRNTAGSTSIIRDFDVSHAGTIGTTYTGPAGENVSVGNIEHVGTINGVAGDILGLRVNIGLDGSGSIDNVKGLYLNLAPTAAAVTKSIGIHIDNVNQTTGAGTALQIEEGHIVYTEDADTIADTGDANPAAATLTPAAAYVELTCNDADTCDITMGETGIVSGTQLLITNVSSNACDFADTVGVSELSGIFAMGQYDALSLQYIGDRWIETGRSNN